MWKEQAVEQQGLTRIASDYDDDYVITKALLEDGRKHLVLRSEVPLDCPVRLIHGLEDTSVPWETALRLQEMLRSTDVEVMLVKGGDHRLSKPDDLDRLGRTLAALLD